MSERTVQLNEVIPLLREQLASGQSVKFFPKGNSMLPMLKPGRDSVILSPVPEHLRRGDLPLYQRENGQYVLHRVIAAGECYTCCGDNLVALETDVKHSQMIALVTSFTRNGKTVSVNAWSYRFYSHFWMAIRPARRVWRKGKSLLKRLIGSRQVV